MNKSKINKKKEFNVKNNNNLQIKLNLKNSLKFKNIAILATDSTWYIPYASELVRNLQDIGYNSKLFCSHKNISNDFEIVFILSYHQIIEDKYLKKHKHNLIIHASALPKGKGWAPLFWQIIEGKNEIPVVLFEANKDIDAGKIYIEDIIIYNGYELNKDLRKKLVLKIKEMVLFFLQNFEKLTPKPQTGESTYYPRRTPEDSKIDLNRTIKEQFNLLRTVNNQEFPAFFIYKGRKYILKIKQQDDEELE